MKPSFVEGAVEVVKIIAYICFSTENDKNLMSDNVKIMSVHVIKLFGASHLRLSVIVLFWKNQRNLFLRSY